MIRTRRSYTLLALLLSLITLSSCDTTESTTPAETDPKPSFTATLNGQPWTVTGNLPPDELMSAQLLVNGSQMLIRAGLTPNNSDALQLKLTSPKEGVNLLMPSMTQPQQTASILFGDQDSLYFMSEVDSGQVIIDHFEESTTRISGTFWFTATNAKAQTLSVASGQFKDILLRKD